MRLARAVATRLVHRPAAAAAAIVLKTQRAAALQLLLVLVLVLVLQLVGWLPVGVWRRRRGHLRLLLHGRWQLPRGLVPERRQVMLLLLLLHRGGVRLHHRVLLYGHGRASVLLRRRRVVHGGLLLHARVLLLLLRPGTLLHNCRMLLHARVLLVARVLLLHAGVVRVVSGELLLGGGVLLLRRGVVVWMQGGVVVQEAPRRHLHQGVRRVGLGSRPHGTRPSAAPAGGAAGRVVRGVHVGRRVAGVGVRVGVGVRLHWQRHVWRWCCPRGRAAHGQRAVSCGGLWQAGGEDGGGGGGAITSAVQVLRVGGGRGGARHAADGHAPAAGCEGLQLGASLLGRTGQVEGQEGAGRGCVSTVHHMALASARAFCSILARRLWAGPGRWHVYRTCVGSLPGMRTGHLQPPVVCQCQQ